MTTTRERLAAHFPVFALEVRTPRVTLRFPDDDDLVELAELGARGVHDPETMPFTVPWTRISPPFQQRNTLQYFWTQRGTLQAEAWNVPLATVVDGRVVGSQGVFATKDWKVTKTVETGSWLGREHHGQGIGKEMRVAALHLAFDGFGAEEAVTAAFEDNPSSLGVTKALGYRPNGTDRVARNGNVIRLCRYTMSRDDFAGLRRDDIEVHGAAPVVELFGTAQVPEGSELRS